MRMRMGMILFGLLLTSVIASAALLGIVFIPSVFGEVINNMFLTRWGNIISPIALMKNVSAGLFGTFIRADVHMRLEFGGNVVREVILNEPPLWCSWAALFVISAICLGLLARKVKAYEVVK